MNQLLSIKEKIAYGLGDTASNLVWQTAMIFLAYFYTDVYGLSPGVMGTMFLLLRCMDAITDPMMGALCDRTRSKHGQFRPYLLWCAIPFGVACAITFYTPNLGSTGKIIYAFVTYGILTLLYTAINVPYCAMASSLTANSQERTSLQSYRFALSTMGGLIIALLALPLVKLIGGEDDLGKVINPQNGYFGAMIIMGALAIILFLVCFKNTKERIELPVSSSGIKEDIKVLFKNQQWRIIFIANIILLLAVVMRGTVMMYYIDRVLNRHELATYFIAGGMIAAIIGAIITAPLFGKLDKVKTYKAIIFVSLIIFIGSFFIPKEWFMLALCVHLVVSLIQMMSTPLLWSMMSDVVDYEKAVSGKQLGGLVFASVLFAIKFGLALGGAVVGWSLAIAGYDANLTVQPDNVIALINMLFTIIPGLLFIPLILVMNNYGLNNEKLESISLALKEKRLLAK
ncbi:transporter [Gammaproteobacteria bacterium]|nr:transporter [Gammaproteobacteria bacterium]